MGKIIDCFTLKTDIMMNWYYVPSLLKVLVKILIFGRTCSSSYKLSPRSDFYSFVYTAFFGWYSTKLGSLFFRTVAFICMVIKKIIFLWPLLALPRRRNLWTGSAWTMCSTFVLWNRNDLVQYRSQNEEFELLRGRKTRNNPRRQIKYKHTKLYILF